MATMNMKQHVFSTQKHRQVTSCMLMMAFYTWWRDGIAYIDMTDQRSNFLF